MPTALPSPAERLLLHTACIYIPGRARAAVPVRCFLHRATPHKFLLHRPRITSYVVPLRPGSPGSPEVLHVSAQAASINSAVSGNIALVRRGTCPFNLKAANLEAAGTSTESSRV